MLPHVSRLLPHIMHHAADTKEKERQRDLQQMKETRDRSDVLESTCGELTEQLARMREQRDVLRVKAAHARFGARTQGTTLHAGASAGTGGASANESGHRSRDRLSGGHGEGGEGGSSDDGTEDTWREVRGGGWVGGWVGGMVQRGGGGLPYPYPYSIKTHPHLIFLPDFLTRWCKGLATRGVRVMRVATATATVQPTITTRTTPGGKVMVLATASHCVRI